MRLTIFGATGATGTSLVGQALAAGHDVTAVVRDPARLTLAPGRQARVITADVMDPAAISLAVADADAVLTVIGPRGTGPTTVSRDSVSSIIQAMRKNGVRRLLAVTGSIVADEGESPYLRYLIKPIARRTFLRHVTADMRGAEQEIRASDLDWTILRPPSLSDKPSPGSYRTAVDRSLPHAFTIPRADLAACMLSLTGEPGSVHHHLAIAS